MDIVNLFARKKAENLSLPGGKVVRGHLIPRLPLGEYLAALQALQNLPADLLSACFPGKSLTEVLQALKTLDEQALVQLVANLAGSGAPYVLGLVARFSGIPEKELREDPAIGLDGLVEILQAPRGGRAKARLEAEDTPKEHRRPEHRAAAGGTVRSTVNGWGNVLAAVREALPQKPESKATTPTGSRA